MSEESSRLATPPAGLPDKHPAALEATRLRRRVLGLAYFTVAWNVAEAVVALGAGVVADSIALIGFGLDSLIEVFSAVVVLWQFLGASDEREARALRWIACSFFLLAAYVTGQAIFDLIRHQEPAESAVGIALAVASLIVMPLLALAKRRAGRALGSRTVMADSTETLLCSYLSAILLGGLILHATVGWWWADPLAALGIAALAAREGVEAWRGEVDCC
jgi:divalent metal cation (Fe/Co/Zn/Cd) transporter